MCPTSLARSRGLKGGDGRNCGIGELLPRLARLDRVRKLAFFFVRGHRPRPRRKHHHVSAGRRRTGGQGRLDVGLGGRRGRDAQPLRRRRAGDHIPAHRYALEGARDAISPSRGSCVPCQPGIRAREVRNPKLKDVYCRQQDVTLKTSCPASCERYPDITGQS